MSFRFSRATLVLPSVVLLFAAVPAAAQSGPAPAAKSQDPAVSSTSSAVPVTDTNAAPAKRVWTNENLNEARGTVSVVGDKRSQKSLGTPSKPGGPATSASVRQDL